MANRLTTGSGLGEVAPNIVRKYMIIGNAGHQNEIDSLEEGRRGYIMSYRPLNQATHFVSLIERSSNIFPSDFEIGLTGHRLYNQLLFLRFVVQWYQPSFS